MLLVALAAAAAGAGVALRWAAPGAPVPGGARAILEVSLPDAAGRAQSVGQWQGKVLIVNFWATWCDPCREEIPEFIKVQEKYRDRGVLFVGIALDEPDKAAAYAREAGINYPVLYGKPAHIDLSIPAGNEKRLLPFTVFIGRNGEIAATRMGGLTQAKLETIISGMI